MASALATPTLLSASVLLITAGAPFCKQIFMVRNRDRTDRQECRRCQQLLIESRRLRSRYRRLNAKVRRISNEIIILKTTIEQMREKIRVLRDNNEPPPDDGSNAEEHREG
ncbi:hypothetical protein QR680_013739 [Steinernema hermaphroditum]|uniref:BZIP domain-containing protein n=1 Tax=Steinernema hermaphroditum TaxID=289476 RepID=A0AA39M314_9BILA|nr:hypothetical protein QR680_013739 [Steinernema hermaphroditum]